MYGLISLSPLRLYCFQSFIMANNGDAPNRASAFSRCNLVIMVCRIGEIGRSHNASTGCCGDRLLRRICTATHLLGRKPLAGPRLGDCLSERPLRANKTVETNGCPASPVLECELCSYRFGVVPNHLRVRHTIFTEIRVRAA